MNASLFYCTKIILSAGLFILIYRLFVRNSNAFGWNRFYLLFTMLLSLFLPYIDISSWFANEEPVLYYASMLTIPFDQTVTVTAQTPQHFLNLNDWIKVGYWTIATLFLIRFLWGVTRIIVLITNADYQPVGKLKLHRTERKSSFSFFNHIFIQPGHWNKPEIDYVLRHEQAHVEHLHSIDSIIAELILVFGWFNPFYYIYRKDLHLLHECQADQAVLNSDYDKITYHQLLLNEVSGNLTYIIVNQFSYSLIKKRFKMISKNKQSRFARLKVLLAIPAAFALMMLFSFTSLEKSKNLLGNHFNLPSIADGQNAIGNILGLPQKPVTQKKPVKSTIKFTPPVIRKDTVKNKVYSTFYYIKPDPTLKEASNKTVYVTGYAPKENGQDTVLTVVEKNPEFPGGLDALLSFMSKNIKYPKEASEKGIQGTVFVQFIVRNTGKISNAKVLRGVGGGCDEEAVRVINNMPDWIPGMQNKKNVSVLFQIPVKFQLSSGQVMKGKAQAAFKTPANEEKRYMPDQNPEFPGGHDALMKFIAKNVKYPAEAIKMGMTGTVFVQFTVTKTGDISMPKILRGIGNACDQEAIKIVNMMPKWTPGLKDGKPIDVIDCIPIKFQLAK